MENLIKELETRISDLNIYLKESKDRIKYFEKQINCTMEEIKKQEDEIKTIEKAIIILRKE